MHRNISLLRWFNFFTDFRLYAPVAILYFAEVSGSFALGMSVFSATMLASALLEIPTGIFSDRIGRKYTVVCGALAATAAVICYAAAGSLTLLIAGAIAEGLSRAFYSGNNDALLHDTLSAENRQDQFGEVLGKLSSYSQIALATSAVGGAILAALSFRTVIWLSVLPQAICVLLSLRLVDNRRHDHKSSNVYSHLREALVLFWNNPKLRLLSLSDMLNFAFSESTYLFQSAFYQTVWPVWAIGIAKATSNLGAAAGFHFSGRLMRRFHSFRILITAYVVRRVVTMIGAGFPGILSPVLMVSSSVPWAVAHTAQNTLLQQEFASSKRATMASLNSFGGSILFAVLATVTGALADVMSPGMAIVLIQSVSLFNLALYWRLFRHHRD